MTNKGISQAAATAQVKKTETEVYISFGRMEWAALRQTCLRSLRLYSELKWLANFKTGVVGTFGQQKLTYEGLAQLVAIPVRQGMSASHATVDGTEIRRLLERLVSLGLVADLFHDGTRLTMTLPMSPIRLTAASRSATKTKTETLKKPRGVDPFLLDYFEQNAASAGSDNRWQDAGGYGEKLPTVAEKLPIAEHPESAENPHEDWGSDDSAPSLSVLTNSNTNHYFSVIETGEALASPNTGGACGVHAPPPHPEVRPLLEGFDSAEWTMGELEIVIALKAVSNPGVLFLDHPNFSHYLSNIEAMGVKEKELYDAIEAIRMDRRITMTPSAILHELRRARAPKQMPFVRGNFSQISRSRVAL